MEYNGIQYQLVQTACPTGWKWTILFDDNRTKVGQQANRAEAIAKAERAIDKHLRDATIAGRHSSLHLNPISGPSNGSKGTAARQQTARRQC